MKCGRNSATRCVRLDSVRRWAKCLCHIHRYVGAILHGSIRARDSVLRLRVYRVLGVDLGRVYLM